MDKDTHAHHEGASVVGTGAGEAWSTAQVRDAVRAVVRSSPGLAVLGELLEEQDGGDPVWCEDALIRRVVDRLRWQSA